MESCFRGNDDVLHTCVKGGLTINVRTGDRYDNLSGAMLEAVSEISEGFV